MFIDESTGLVVERTGDRIRRLLATIRRALHNKDRKKMQETVGPLINEVCQFMREPVRKKVEETWEAVLHGGSINSMRGELTAAQKSMLGVEGSFPRPVDFDETVAEERLSKHHDSVDYFRMRVTIPDQGENANRWHTRDRCNGCQKMIEVQECRGWISVGYGGSGIYHIPCLLFAADQKLRNVRRQLEDAETYLQDVKEMALTGQLWHMTDVRP